MKVLYKELDKRGEEDQPSQVRCYLGHGLSRPRHRSVSSRFFFNTTAEGRVERNDIGKAELRLKFQYSGRRRDNVGSRSEVLVEVVRKPETKRRDAKLSVLNSTTISTTTATRGFHLTIDVTHLARDHLSRRRKNLEIYVTVRGLAGSKVPSLQLIDEDPDTKPLFLVYIQSEKERRRQDKSKRLREKARYAVDGFAASEERQTTRERRSRGNNVASDRHQYTAHRSTNSEFCSLQRLTISFRALNWSFIIAPTQFEANWCSGTCPQTLTESFNPTVHAILQSLFHWHVDTNIAQPCCVPDKLGSLNVLFYDQKDVITYKSFHGMRATSCGCH